MTTDSDSDSDSGQTLEATVRRTNDPLVGSVVDGRFEVKSLLGQGGMGSVYVAWQPSVGREVALKVLRGHFQNDDELVKRFEREIRLCAQLSHPNVVTVHDAGVANGVLFMAMERLAGRTLADLIADGPLTPQRAVHLAAQVCDALSAAHERGIIHRDIKPSNVMVLNEPAGRDVVKVLDFGIATVQDGERLTRTHGVLGSPNAIAPEVIKSSKNVSPKADLYAVGTLLYEALTGAPPFGTDTANAVFMRQVSTTPPSLPPTVPPGLRALVTELIDPEPQKRPADASVVRARLLAPQTLATNDVGTVREVVGPAPSRSSLRLVLAVGLALTVVAVGWMIRSRSPADPPPVDPPASPGRSSTVPPALPALAPPSVDAGHEEGDAGAPQVDAGLASDAGAARPPARKPPGARPKKTDYEE